MVKKLSRRQLFSLGPRVITHGRQVSDDLREQPIRPPGANRDQRAFLDTCERCHQCADACPFDAVFVLEGPEHGEHEHTPYMKPMSRACRWCKDMPCVQACPSDALAFHAEMPANTDAQEYYQYVDPIAKIDVKQSHCMLSQGVLCDECSLFCPSHTKSILVLGRNVRVKEDACTGCGLCSVHCPATPNAISVIPLG